MNSPVNPHPITNLSRRELINTTLMLGGAAVLFGCQPAQRSGVVSLPPGVWPDPKDVAATPVKLPAPKPPSSNGTPQGVIARAEWTDSRPNLRVSKPMNGVTRITVHHSALNSTGLSSRSQVINILESIQRNHTARTDRRTGAKWVDIGYHYIIDPSGRVWEGRPVSIEGAHVSRTNDHNLGVMLLGHFDQHRPTDAALNTLDGFVASQMRRYKLGIRNVFTHQELSPSECPGRYLQQYMKQTRASSGRMAGLA